MTRVGRLPINLDDIEEALVVNEVPVGDINGINKDFTTAYPFRAGTVKLKRNGMAMKGTDDYIVVSDTEIQFIRAPRTGANVLIDYMRGDL